MFVRVSPKAISQGASIMRFVLLPPLIGLLALAGCGEVDLQKAGTNAALAALEASNPEVVQGIRAAQTLQQAAATCGWEDVDAAGLAKTAVSGIEEPPLRAAASSLVEDLIVADAPPVPDAATIPASDCSPEVRQALQNQIAAIARGSSEEGGG
jgi:hypothetical protein